jgi:hypothetical protein
VNNALSISNQFFTGAVRVKNTRPVASNTGKGNNTPLNNCWAQLITYFSSAVLKPVNRDPIHPPAVEKADDKTKNGSDESGKLAKANQQVSISSLDSIPIC